MIRARYILVSLLVALSACAGSETSVGSSFETDAGRHVELVAVDGVEAAGGGVAAAGLAPRLGKTTCSVV